MTTPSQDRQLATPIVDAATEPFWNAARDGILTLRRCIDCSKVHWYPRALCPFCMGDTAWIAASGRGTIYSLTVTRKVGPVPYALAYVQLEEGVTLLTNIVDCDLDALQIGDRVRVTFKPAEGGAAIPMFTPE